MTLKMTLKLKIQRGIHPHLSPILLTIDLIRLLAAANIHWGPGGGADREFCPNDDYKLPPILQTDQSWISFITNLHT